MAARLLSLLLAAAALAVFAPSLPNDFVWDDRQYVLENPRVAGGLTAENVAWALTSLEAGNWHPLTWASHMLDVELFGMRPWGHRLVNLALHAANAVLLFTLLRGLTGALWRSLLVAALFAVHPLHVESVVWVAERKDLLSTLLGLGAIAAYLGYVRRGGAPRYAAAAGLFAFGLAAKPMLVTLPFVLLLIDGWPLGRLDPAGRRRAVLEKLPLLALAAGSSAVTLAAQVGAGAYSHYPLDARLSNAVVGYARYLAKAAAPVNLAVFYPHAERALPWWQSAGALLALASVTAVAISARRRRPWLAVGWFWFVGTLVPVIGVIQVGQQAIADRYTYLPLVGVFLAAAWGAGELASRGTARGAARVAAVAVAAVLILGATSVRQVHVWRDQVSLYTHAIEAAPGNWLAHFNLGYHYQQQGRLDEAAEHYRAALAARPDHGKSLNNLGTIAAAQGRSAEALDHYRRALGVHPAPEEVLGNIGAELARQGRLAEAEASFLQALQRRPDLLEARLNLAELMLRQQRPAEAASRFEEILRTNRGSARARNGLGVALARQGRYREAIAQFREVLRADPGDRGAAANLARAQARLQD